MLDIFCWYCDGLLKHLSFRHFSGVCTIEEVVTFEKILGCASYLLAMSLHKASAQESDESVALTEMESLEEKVNQELDRLGQGGRWVWQVIILHIQVKGLYKYLSFLGPCLL